MAIVLGVPNFRIFTVLYDNSIAICSLNTAVPWHQYGDSNKHRRCDNNNNSYAHVLAVWMYVQHILSIIYDFLKEYNHCTARQCSPLRRKLLSAI